MENPFLNSKPQTKARFPPKRGQVLIRILKSFSKSEKPSDNGASLSPNLSTTASSPSGYASETQSEFSGSHNLGK